MRPESKKKIYSGVGNPYLPEQYFPRIEEVAKALAEDGWTLRTGGYFVPDRIFVNGANSAECHAEVELYLPWKNRKLKSYNKSIPDEAIDMGEKFNKNWHKLNPKQRKVQANSLMVMLGLNLDDPSDVCLVCDNKNSETFLTVLATQHEIDIVRLFNPLYTSTEIVVNTMNSLWNKKYNKVD